MTVTIESISELHGEVYEMLAKRPRHEAVGVLLGLLASYMSTSVDPQFAVEASIGQLRKLTDLYVKSNPEPHPSKEKLN